MPVINLPPIHPGEILREEFMRPLGLSMNRLALGLHVPANRISDILNGKRTITASTALRLAAFFKNSPQFWMNLQTAYELEVANRAEASAVKEEVKAFSERSI